MQIEYIGKFQIRSTDNNSIWISSIDNEDKQIEVKVVNDEIEVIPRAHNRLIPFAVPNDDNDDWVGVRTIKCD
jgi:hypothetical protein